MAPRPRAWLLQRCVRGAWLAACLGVAGGVQADVVSATFGGPTDVYAHCILGDCVEYTTLEIVSDQDGRQTRHIATLPDGFVFEDVAPRLWDLTGDGAPEVVVILTSVDLGASLAVFDAQGLIAQTPHIGRSNRWLAPVGAADFDGDGKIEVAFVDRPHMAKTLRIFEWTDDGLTLEAEVAGVTNHRIGEDFISGGVRDCGEGPQIVTVNADWSQVMITAYDGVWRSARAGTFSPRHLAAVLDCQT